MAKERKRWIDVLKGIGAILVLFGHLVPYNSRLKIYIYSFHMPLFFFISGYLFRYDKNISKFTYKKIKSLLLPYIVFSVISFNVSYFLEGIYLSRREALYNILFLKGVNSFNTSLWFLITMFFSVMIFELLFKLIDKLNIRITNLKSLICIIALLIINLILLKFNIKLLFGLEIVPHALLMMSIGYIFNKENKKIFELNSTRNWIMFIVIFICLFIISQINGKITMSTSEYNNYALYLIISLLNIIIYIIIAKKVSENKILEKLSSLSLVMFCTQRLIFKFIYVVQRKLDITLLDSNNLLINITMTILLIIVYLLYDYIKEVIKMKKKLIATIVIFITIFCININNVEAKESGWEVKGNKYYYYDSKTDSYLTGWQNIDGLKYYFDKTTKERLQGIHEVDGIKYFFGVTKGKVMYGWVDYDGKKYYTDPTTGVLASNVTKVGNDYYFFGINTNRLMYGEITDYDGEKYLTDESGKLRSGMIEVNGKWYYFDKNNNFKATSGWKTVDNLKYYFDKTTKERLQGIHTVDGTKYFFGVTKGKVMYGWIDYDGKKYYTDPTTGVLASNVTKVGNDYYFFGINTNRLMYGEITDYDGEKYLTDESGKLRSGMIEVNDNWYYFDKNNNFKAASGVLKLDDGEYYFDKTTKIRAKNVTKVDGKYYFYGIKYGKKQFDLIYYDDEYYYAHPTTGELSTGWTTIDGNLYYYLPDSKKRAKGVTEIDGKYYFLGIKYGLVQKGWVYYDGLTYYADPTTGELYTGWKEIDGNRYFFGLKTKRIMKGWFVDPDTSKLYFLDYDTGIPANGFREVDSSIYYFESGKYITGERTIDGKKYYFYDNGKMRSNFVNLNGKTYFYYEDGTKATGWTIIGQTKYYFNPSGVQLGANVKKIIDISRFNGDIDWDKVVREDNVDGVILRINDPRYDLGTEDPKLEDNIKAIKRLGIPYGLYMYSYGSSYQDGVDYAKEALRIIGKYRMNPTLGIFLDIEGNGINDNYSTSQFEASAKGFIETLDKNGQKSQGHLYTYKYYAENVLNSEYLHNNITWIAQYNNTGCTYNGAYKMWQYTSEGVVKGIIGNVDISILFQ